MLASTARPPRTHGLAWEPGASPLRHWGPRYAVASGAALVITIVIGFGVFGRSLAPMGFLVPGMAWILIFPTGLSLLRRGSTENGYVAVLFSTAFAVRVSAVIVSYLVFQSMTGSAFEPYAA